MQLFRLTVLSLIVGLTLVQANAAWSQQTPAASPGTTPAPLTPPAAPDQPTLDVPIDPALPDLSGDNNDAMSIGDIPAVQTEELTADVARKALDAYVLVQTKYQDSPLENYDDLQAFVNDDARGKEFEADIKSFGFSDVNNWNLAVTTLSFAYTNALDDQTSDIKQQIDEITTGTEMAQDMKDRMIASLKAMIPSPNNAKIVGDLIADPVYGDKIKLLETTEE